ncbi:hypothetical protein GQ600_15016 [Phytophthora cactorum]|nr:hypothetical protein GQ600_15016 [Phytophthora cactorum]
MLRPHGDSSTSKLSLSGPPSLHRLPWRMEDRVPKHNIWQSLKVQSFKKVRTELGKDLRHIVPRLDDAARSSPWQRSAWAKQLWNHRNAMTEYHVWVAYRTTTAQLNLFHPGRPLDNSCLTLKACSGHKKPLQHIFWDYKCARIAGS